MATDKRDHSPIGDEAATEPPSLGSPTARDEGVVTLTCTVCGATPARATGEVDPDLGPVSLCAKHSTRQLDWT